MPSSFSALTGLPRCSRGRLGSSFSEATPPRVWLIGAVLAASSGELRRRRVGRSGSLAGVSPELPEAVWSEATGCAVQGGAIGIVRGSAGGRGRARCGGCRIARAGLGGARGEVRAVVILVEAVDDAERLGGLQGRGLGRSWRNELAVAEPAVVVGGCRRLGGHQVAREGQVERAQRNAGPVELVDIAGGERERDGPRQVDGGVFELAVDEERDRDEAAGGGLGHIARPLVDADRAHDVLRRGDLVGLRAQGPARGNAEQQRAQYSGAGERVPQ